MMLAQQRVHATLGARRSFAPLAPRAAVARPAAPAQPLAASRPALRAMPALAPRPASRTARLQVSASAGAAAPAPFKWGANMKDLSICIGIGVAMWFCPAPAGVAPKAWQLLSVFVATIVGIITTPLPLGAVAILGLGAAMLTKVLTFAEAFSAFSSEIPWVAAAAPRCPRR
jgi:hypothetical protein